LQVKFSIVTNWFVTNGLQTLQAHHPTETMMWVVQGFSPKNPTRPANVAWNERCHSKRGHALELSARDEVQHDVSSS